MLLLLKKYPGGRYDGQWHPMESGLSTIRRIGTRLTGKTTRPQASTLSTKIHPELNLLGPLLFPYMFGGLSQKTFYMMVV
jgi:hypothetical protein